MHLRSSLYSSKGPFPAAIMEHALGHECLERNSHVALAVGEFLFAISLAESGLKL